MIFITRFLVRLLITAALLLPLANAQALDKFSQAGMISSLAYDKFTVLGVEYRISPGAQLKSNDASRKKLSDFKPGDRIYFEGTVMDGIYRVELVVYKTPVPS